ncbi:MAG: hypothetical protein ABUJ92_00130 [Desulfobacterales bacterium]
MLDPVEQSTNEYHNKLANYNQAVEEMVLVVREDVEVFERFLLDELPGIVDEINDMETFRSYFNAFADDEKIDKLDQYVLEEAKRRVEG